MLKSLHFCASKLIKSYEVKCRMHRIMEAALRKGRYGYVVDSLKRLSSKDRPELIAYIIARRSGAARAKYPISTGAESAIGFDFVQVVHMDLFPLPPAFSAKRFRTLAGLASFSPSPGNWHMLVIPCVPDLMAIGF
jgi:hypothetical protein